MLLRLVLAARSSPLVHQIAPALNIAFGSSSMAPKAKKAKTEVEETSYMHTKEVSGVRSPSTGTVHSTRTHMQRFIQDYEVLKTELMADEIMGDPPAHAKSWFARVGPCKSRLSVFSSPTS